MIKKKRIVLTFLVVGILGLVLGVGSGMVGGQMLAEQTYYDEDYENVTHVDPDVYDLEEKEVWGVSTSQRSDRVIKWDHEGGSEWQTGTSDRPRTVAVLPDSGHIVAGDNDEYVDLKDTTTGTRMHRERQDSNVQTIDTTANNTIYAPSNGGQIVKYDEELNEIWNVDISDNISRSPNLRSSEVTPDGHLITSGSQGIYKVDKNDGNLKWEIEVGDSLDDIRYAVYGLAMFPDGTLYAAEQTQGGSVHKIAVESGQIEEELEQPRNDQIESMAAGPRGNIFVHTRSSSGVVKYSPEMDMIWRNSDIDNSGQDDSISVNAMGNVLVASSGGRETHELDGDTGDDLWRSGTQRNHYSTAWYNEMSQSFDFPNYNEPPPVMDIQEANELDDSYSGLIYSPGWFTSQDEKSLSLTGELEKQMSEDALTSGDLRSAYVIAEVETGTEPVSGEIIQFGQGVGSGSVDENSRGEMVIEFDPQTHELEFNMDSESPYELMNLQLVTLEESEEGDPLTAHSSPIVLDAQEGYDRTISVFVDLLDVGTDTMLYIVMIALIVGAIVFTYTKSVQGQELAQSLVFGAVIAGIVVVGIVPTLNLATWVFTGDIDRAPLANPQLEAEPPTYYSTTFGAGEPEGWSFAADRALGDGRIEQAGDGFNYGFQGSNDESGVIEQDTHIALGHALDTGFVDVTGIVEGQSGLGTADEDAHVVTMNVRVYVTDDGEMGTNDYLDPNTNYVEEGSVEDQIDSHDDLVAIEEVALSFDGEIARSEQMVTFPLTGNDIHTEVVVHDNRQDVDPQGQLEFVRVGATTDSSNIH